MKNNKEFMSWKEWIDVIFTYVCIPLFGYYIAFHPSLISDCDYLFVNFWILVLWILFLILRIFLSLSQKKWFLIFITLTYFIFAYFFFYKVFIDSKQLNDCIIYNQKLNIK